MVDALKEVVKQKSAKRKELAEKRQRVRAEQLVGGNDVFEEGSDETERIDSIDDFVGNGREAWRRLHGGYDPTSSMRRATIRQQVQNAPRCQRVEEDWITKKHHRIAE